MTSSIVLLLVLQLFWLNGSYERAYFGLRREAIFVFRSTLYGLRDSLYQNNIRAVVPDSLNHSLNAIRSENIKSLNVVKGVPYDNTTPATSSSIQVIVSSNQGNPDSLVKALRPMSSQLRRTLQDGSHHSFILRLSPDTLSLDTIRLYLAAAFSKANLPVDFSVTHQVVTPERMPGFGKPEPNDQPETNTSLYSDTLKLESLRFNPANRYAVSVFPVQRLVAQQIAPQIGFSVLLTLITLVAFVILYRNLRTQQRLMEMKNDFIGNVTHELKTPVATVSVALEALKNFHALNDPKLTREYLDIAQSELNRLTLMTDKILKASAFENTGIAIQKERIDIRKITADILDSMRLVFEKRQADVDFQSDGESFSIDGEEAHITNVIYNLIDNALKYSPAQPVIRITLQETPDNVILSVKDHGLGIPAEYKKKIFEKFFRVPTGNIHNIKGYGLGLSYVASVVQAHGATITVESEPGKGSTFIIHWPKVHT